MVELHHYKRLITGSSRVIKTTASDALIRPRKAIHARHLPTLTNYKLLQHLQEHAFATRHIDTLNLETAEKLAGEIPRLRLYLDSMQNGTKGTWWISDFGQVANMRDVYARWPIIYKFGLDNQILDLVENYLGLPPMFVGASLRIDRYAKNISSTRKWHVDPNDHKYLKLIIYLNDVDEHGGPFEWAELKTPDVMAAIRGRKSVTAHELKEHCPQAQLSSMLGPAGTIGFVDTARVYHRGKVPQASRYTLFYSFASQRPRRADLCRESRRKAATATIPSHGLNARQLRALGWNGDRS